MSKTLKGWLFARTAAVGSAASPGVLTHCEEAVFAGETLRVVGWVASRKRLSQVEISVDGEVVHRCEAAIPRPDVERSHPEFENARGVEASIAVPRRPGAGERRVELCARDVHGNSAVDGRDVSVSEPVYLYLDHSEISASIVLVEGWAYSAAGIDRIEIWVDENRVGEAFYGLSRSDVVTQRPDLVALERCGFSAALGVNVSGDRSEHELGIRVFAKDGGRAEQTIRAARHEAVRVQCDDLVLSPSFCRAAGWAMARAGIDRVEVSLDGKLLGYADLGLPRPDVERAFPAIAASNAGFRFELVLDEPIEPGERVLSVTTFSKNGATSRTDFRRNIGSAHVEYFARSRPSPAQLAWMSELGAALNARASFEAVVVFSPARHASLTDSLAAVAETLESLSAQCSPCGKIVIVVDDDMPEAELSELERRVGSHRALVASSSALQGIVARSQAEYLLLVEAGHVLEPHATFELAQAAVLHGAADVVYSDNRVQGSKDARGYQPDFSADLLLAKNYIGGCFAVRRAAFLMQGGLRPAFAPERLYDALLRLSEHGQIVHVPDVLWLKFGEPKPSEATRAVVEDALARRRIAARVEIDPASGLVRVRRTLLARPLVSIVILTAFNRPDENLWRCIASIAASSYDNLEVVVVHNSDGALKEEELLGRLPGHIKCRAIQFEERFNYSRMNNLGVRGAAGDYVVFLNDDTEVLVPDWIEALLEQAQRSDVGVVGCKLLNDDGTIQHAGVVLIDQGGAGRHVLRGAPADALDYAEELCTVRDCSVVTFACVMVQKLRFFELGGLDEALRVECNDADFCMRARQAGYRVIFTPFASLRHREAATRRGISVTSDVVRHWSRWRRHFERGDPFYNPNLTLDGDYRSPSVRTVVTEGRRALFDSRPYECKISRNIEPGSIKRILAVKADHIGDMVLALPALALLKRRFPDAHLTLLVGPWSEPIARACPHVDDVLIFNAFEERSELGPRGIPQSELERLCSLLSSRNFDLAIDFRRHAETRFVLGLSGAPHTVGFATDDTSGDLTVAALVPPEASDEERRLVKPHTAAQLCRLVASIPGALNGATDPDAGLIRVPDPVLKLRRVRPSVRVRELLDGAAVPIGIHPGVGSSIRQWAPHYFARLCDRLAERPGVRIVLCGSPADRIAAEQIRDSMQYSDRVVIAAGETGLEDFIDIARLSRIFIGNNSGPCHLAAALGTPTLVIFGGQVSVEEWHPLGRLALTIRSAVPCAPCYLSTPDRCRHSLKCLSSIWPEQVARAADRLLALAEIIDGEAPTSERRSVSGLPFARA